MSQGSGAPGSLAWTDLYSWSNVEKIYESRSRNYHYNKVYGIRNNIMKRGCWSNSLTFRQEANLFLALTLIWRLCSNLGLALYGQIRILSVAKEHFIWSYFLLFLSPLAKEHFSSFWKCSLHYKHTSIHWHLLVVYIPVHGTLPAVAQFL